MLGCWALLVLGLSVRTFAAGTLGSAGASAPPVVEPMRIDLNRAQVADLQALPGIGVTRAEAIVLHRVRNGSFERVDQLDQVDGIGATTIAALRPFLFVAPAGGAASER